MSGPLLFRGVDGQRSRSHWWRSCAGPGSWCRQAGLPASWLRWVGLSPRSRSELYWAARLTLVNRAEDLPTFDAVISAVFDDAVLGLDPPSLKSSLGGAVAAVPGLSRAHGTTLDGAGLPWTTRPMSITAADATQDEPASTCPTCCPAGWWHVSTTRSKLRRRRSASHRQLARAGLRALAASAQPAAGAEQARDANRHAPHHACLADHRLGDDAVGSIAPSPSPAPGGPAV